MNRIEIKIQNLQEQNKKAFVGYIMAGEFGIPQTVEIMNEGVKAGLDILELGFPFSDPTAEGEIIQESARKAIENGTKMNDVFNIVADFRKNNQETPIILMGYFNIVFKYGEENFLKKCQEVGVDGLIIVDFPIEESLYFEQMAEKYGVFVIQIVSFLTNVERFNQIQARAKGFIYLVSTLGVTGKQKPMLERIASYIEHIKPKLPIFVGFGINSPESAKEISQYCDGIIVGSYLIKSLRDNKIQGFTDAINGIKQNL